MTRYLVVPLVCVLAASAALATCPTVSRPVVSAPLITSSYLPSVTYKPAVVVKKVAVVKEVPVLIKYVAVIPLVEVPSYSAVYHPPLVAPPPVAPPAAAPAPAAAPPPGLAEVMAELRKMSARIESISNRMDALEGRPPTPALPKLKVPGVKELPPPTVEKNDTPGTLTALSIVQAKCAKCHEAKVSAAEGKSLTLIAGGALSLITDKEAKKLVRECYTGKMPKKGYGIAPLTDEENAVLVLHYTK